MDAASRRNALWLALPLIALGLGACGDDSTGTPDGGDAEAGDGADGADVWCPADVTPVPGLVVTQSGAVRGVESEGGGWEFLGVPFAKPPVDELRWRPPEDPDCWGGEWAATEWAEVCAQKSFDITTVPPPEMIEGAEDCLYLNIWTPRTGAANLPVLFFIHGGGNQQGSARDEALGATMYEGRLLSQRGEAVVVTIQYRLGIFGFFAHPDLVDGDGHVGNYGMLDQIQALRWVRRNIAGFGGDPDNVLLFGQSAGAIDVCALVASPLSAGLYSAALMQSGACIVHTTPEAQALAESMAADVGCDGADAATCLRGLGRDALVAPIEPPELNGITNLQFLPVVDGWFLPSAPLEQFAAGAHNHVPFVIGTNADEVKIMVPEGSITPADVDDFFARFDEPLRSELAALYPAGSTAEEAREAYVQALSDAQFTCQARIIARAVAAGQSEAVRRYFFTHTVSGPLGAQFGASHGIENFYLFQTAEASYMAILLNDGDYAVEASLLGYWTRFAATGDPNGDGAPAWDPYDPATDSYLELAVDPTPGAGLHTDACDLWEPITAIPPAP